PGRRCSADNTDCSRQVKIAGPVMRAIGKVAAPDLPRRIFKPVPVAETEDGQICAAVFDISQLYDHPDVEKGIIVGQLDAIRIAGQGLVKIRRGAWFCNVNGKQLRGDAELRAKDHSMGSDLIGKGIDVEIESARGNGSLVTADKAAIDAKANLAYPAADACPELVGGGFQFIITRNRQTAVNARIVGELPASKQLPSATEIAG